MKSTKEILESILKELEVVRSGEVPRIGGTLTLDGKSFEFQEITKDFAQGFTEGKNLAFSIVYEWLDYLKRETQ